MKVFLVLVAILTIFFTINLFAVDENLINTQGSDIKYDLSGKIYLYKGQKLDDIISEVKKDDFYVNPQIKASDPNSVKLQDGLIDWGGSIHTNFWSSQNKTIEVIYDLKDVYNISKVEVIQTANRDTNDSADSVEVFYGVLGATDNKWDGSLIATAMDTTTVNINKPARFLRFDIKTGQPMMSIGEIKIYGELASPTKKESPIKAISGDLRRFEIENVKGTVKEERPDAFGRFSIWLSKVNVDFQMPDSSVWDIWVRYMDNGPRPMKVSINNSEYVKYGYTEGYKWVKVGSTKGKTKLNIENAGEQATLLDSVIFSKNKDFDPNKITSFGDIMSIKEIDPILLPVEKYLKNNKAVTDKQLAEYAAKYYNIPLAKPVKVVDDNGSILWNGKPFFSQLIFHCNPNDAELATTKLNTFSSISDEQFKRGIAAAPSYHEMWYAYDKISEIFKVNSGSKKTFLHYICDEPENVKVSPANLRRLNTLFKTLDPTKPTFINVSTSFAANSTVLAIPDVVGVDIYPIPGGSISDIGSVLDRVRISSNNRPVIFIAQTFSWGSYGSKTSRFPTKEEIRAMSYLAIIHNARGIWYYEWAYPLGSDKTLLSEQPEIWKDMKNMISEISTISPAILGPEVKPPFTVTSEAKKAPEFRLAVSEDRKTAYLIGVNTNAESASATVNFDILTNVILKPEFKNIDFKDNGKNSFTVNFNGFDSVIFSVKATGLDKLVKLSTKQVLDILTNRVDNPKDKSYAVVSYSDKAPEMTSGETDKTWDKATDLLDSGWKSPNRPSTAKVVSSKDGLYIKVVTRFPKDVKSNALKRDGDVWGDPSVEIFFGNPINKKKYIHIAVNTANVIFDQMVDTNEEEMNNLAFDTNIKTSVSAGSEIAEYHIFIPWSDIAKIGVKPGEKLMFNLASDASKWDWVGLTGAGYHNSDRYGVLELK